MNNLIPEISADLQEYDTTGLTHHQYALLVSAIDTHAGATYAEVQSILDENAIPFSILDKKISCLLTEYHYSWHNFANYLTGSMQLDKQNPVCPNCGEETIHATHARLTPSQLLGEDGLTMVDGECGPCTFKCESCKKPVYWKATLNIAPKKILDQNREVEVARILAKYNSPLSPDLMANFVDETMTISRVFYRTSKTNLKTYLDKSTRYERVDEIVSDLSKLLDLK